MATRLFWYVPVQHPLYMGHSVIRYFLQTIQILDLVWKRRISASWHHSRCSIFSVVPPSLPVHLYLRNEPLSKPIRRQPIHRRSHLFLFGLEIEERKLCKHVDFLPYELHRVVPTGTSKDGCYAPKYGYSPTDAVVPPTILWAANCSSVVFLSRRTALTTEAETQTIMITKSPPKSRRCNASPFMMADSEISLPQLVSCGFYLDLLFPRTFLWNPNFSEKKHSTPNKRQRVRWMSNLNVTHHPEDHDQSSTTIGGSS